MKCPHCDYITGWDNDKLESVDGKEGDFWNLPIKVERSSMYVDERAALFGCPKCKKTFIQEY